MTFSGDTGWNDAGTGSRGLQVEYDAGFTKIIGGSVNSQYSGMPGAYQAFSKIYSNYVDNYVIKPEATQKMRGIQFVIYGLFS